MSKQSGYRLHQRLHLKLRGYGMNRNPVYCLVRPDRFERPTPRFEAWYSIQLSYGRVNFQFNNPDQRALLIYLTNQTITLLQKTE